MELCMKTQDLRISILRIWVVYIKHLCTRLDKSNMYGFIDPNFIQTQNDRASSQSHIIEKLLENDKDCFFVPYINNHHWQLLIIEPKKQNVVFLCSMGLKPDKNIVLTVDLAIDGYNRLKGSRKQRKPTWNITLKMLPLTVLERQGLIGLNNEEDIREQVMRDISSMPAFSQQYPNFPICSPNATIRASTNGSCSAMPYIQEDDEDIPEECELYVDKKLHIVAYANVYNLGPAIHN
ncbi:uncharacterized protein LOC131638393 [Vicia villosa]|uniref:uncharacterized protein LOC131638393 n=1 Tax=Vicia villosa TaxID=3911 RepID=UPI00273B81D3|nr:uncharacterized protein LOC131638393 [Vicia villosa]